MARTGRPGLNLTPERIKWAIKSTQSMKQAADYLNTCLLYTSPSPRDS